MFGFDYTVDMDTNEIFFREMNPRITGSTALSFQAYQLKAISFPSFYITAFNF